MEQCDNLCANGTVVLEGPHLIRHGRIHFSCSDQYLIPHYRRNQGGKHVSNTRQYNPHACQVGYKSEVRALSLLTVFRSKVLCRLWDASPLQK
jgi:hypothetical protein